MVWVRNVALFFIAFLVGADELLLGPILTPIGRDLAVRPESVTLFVTVYSLSNAVCAYGFGVLSDRYGRLTVLVPATLVFAFASVCTGMATHFEMALLFRAFTGAASAGMLPVVFAIAGDTGHHSVRNIAFVSAGLTLGMITSPALGAVLTQMSSWRVAFAALGIIAVPFALLTCIVRTPVFPAPVALPRAPLLVPGALGALIAMGFGLGGGIGIFTLVGERLRHLAGYDTGMVGLVYAGLGIFSVFGNVLMPAASRQLGGSRRLMRVALGVCLVLCLLVFARLSTPLWLVLTALMLWALVGGLGSPALQSHIAQLSPARRGALIALGMSMMHVGVAVSSAVSGLAYAVSPQWIAVVGLVLFGLAILALRPISQTCVCSFTPS